MKLPHLFSPIRIGTMTLKNRVVMAPMETHLGNADGSVSPQMIAYYRERALGGAALVTVEYTCVDGADGFSSWSPQLRLDAPAYRSGHAKLTRSIHLAGAKACIELSHAGRQTRTDVIGVQPVAPSAVPLLARQFVTHPRAMDEADIARLIARFATAAGYAVESGYDAVMLHGAHGYLLHQFLSRRVNRRDDAWGGDFVRRMRFPVEVIRAVRKVIGERPLLYRMSVADYLEDGLTIEDSERIAPVLRDAGVDAFDVSRGSIEATDVIVEPMDIAEGARLALSRRIRAATGTPVLCAGVMRSPAAAEAAIADGDTDIVSLGRALLADPFWPAKAAAGTPDEIRPCTSCNWCVKEVLAQRSVGCAENPRCGHETDPPIGDFGRGKAAVVVGAGPGGIAAALMLSQAGFSVDLFEQRACAGGNLVASATPPGKDKLFWYQLDDWMRSYEPDELFDAHGALREDIASLAPVGLRRMGCNPHANGGELLRALTMPGFRDYAVAVPRPGEVEAEPTRVLGGFVRDLMALNMQSRNFRIFGPDETASNRLDAVYKVVGKAWMAKVEDVDTDLSADGRVMEVLSEHMCQGWLEGYLLTGRHGLFSCYEAFIHIIDSMLNQHAKWLKVCGHIPWRAPIASLNYLLTSHVWRQDHNGFSHQDPGFMDHVANKKSDAVRIYLPPDANCLLSVADHCLRSTDCINVIVAGKQPAWQWLDVDAAARHCSAGASIWSWASNDRGEPDVVMACAGDVPTLETLAAVTLLRTYVPDIRIRVVNVVDLMVLQPRSEHPHGLPDDSFDALFTSSRPVIFAFHGYPSLVHKLTYRRRNHDNIHVRGYKEEGTTTTPFDMVVLNNLDRYQLALDAIMRIPRLAGLREEAQTRYDATIERHKRYIREHGEDMPEVQDWRWSR